MSRQRRKPTEIECWEIVSPVHPYTSVRRYFGGMLRSKTMKFALVVIAKLKSSRKRSAITWE